MSRRLCFVIDVQPKRTSTNELPALAFGSHYSVFKERPRHALPRRRWCRVLRRTVPDRSLCWKVSLGRRKALGGCSDGMVTLADSAPERQRSRAYRHVPGPCLGRSASDGTGTSRPCRGYSCGMAAPFNQDSERRRPQIWLPHRGAGGACGALRSATPHACRFAKIQRAFRPSSAPI